MELCQQTWMWNKTIRCGIMWNSILCRCGIQVHLVEQNIIWWNHVELCGINLLLSFFGPFFVAAACRRPSSILTERSLAASSTLIRLDFPLPKRHSGMLTS